MNYVSLGGLAVGLAIIAGHITLWVMGGKAKGWRGLVLPFLPIFLYGMLLTLSAGGALGWLAHISLWGSNQVGDKALLYGVGSGTSNVTRSVSMVLTPPGHLVVLVATVVLVLIFLRSRKISRLEVSLYFVSGTCLALSSGVAGFFATLMAPGVDTLGGWVAGYM
jgi:hypothetical protein